MQLDRSLHEALRDHTGSKVHVWHTETAACVYMSLLIILDESREIKHDEQVLLLKGQFRYFSISETSLNSKASYVNVIVILKNWSFLTYCWFICKNSQS